MVVIFCQAKSMIWTIDKKIILRYDWSWSSEDNIINIFQSVHHWIQFLLRLYLTLESGVSQLPHIIWCSQNIIWCSQNSGYEQEYADSLWAKQAESRGRRSPALTKRRRRRKTALTFKHMIAYSVLVDLTLHLRQLYANPTETLRCT